MPAGAAGLHLLIWCSSNLLLFPDCVAAVGKILAASFTAVSLMVKLQPCLQSSIFKLPLKIKATFQTAFFVFSKRLAVGYSLMVKRD